MASQDEPAGPIAQPTRADDEPQGRAASGDLAMALGGVLDGYRALVADDVDAIRQLIRSGHIEEALRALEQQRRSLHTAAACVEGVVADATDTVRVGSGHEAHHGDSHHHPRAARLLSIIR